MTDHKPTDAWDAQRHADAIGDTGTSHVLIGRVYAVRCEWCPKIFVGNNKREAMAEFRRHERAVLDGAFRASLTPRSRPPGRASRAAELMSRPSTEGDDQ